MVRTIGKKFGKFKYNIGDHINTFNRDLVIVDCEYRPVPKVKNGVEYTLNEKWCKYHCNHCGNEDWVREYCLDESARIGCNACCEPPKKIVYGINDVSTTAPWMMKYFINAEDAYCNSKYSKQYVLMKCQDCGKIHKKQIHQVMSNNGLSCTCSDNKSYPNKFMYSLLDQIGIEFEFEKSFDWSNNRYYDIYFMNHDCSIIIELNGNQHYNRAINRGDRSRTVDQEKENDEYKKKIAIEHGIDYYFSIDCCESSVDYISKSILQSGLLLSLNIDPGIIDWNLCDQFALSNLVKEICVYKANHNDVTLDDIAGKYHLDRKTVLKYVQKGKALGWCDYEPFEDRMKKDASHKINHGAKRIYCLTTDQYFESASEVAKYFQTTDDTWNPRAIRKSIERGNMYKKHKFVFA